MYNYSNNIIKFFKNILFIIPNLSRNCLNASILIHKNYFYSNFIFKFILIKKI